MKTFNFKAVYSQLLTPEIVFRLTQLHEYKGRLNRLLETDAAVTNIAVPDLLLEKHSLPVQFFFELTLRHTRFRHPGQVFPDLPTVDVITSRYSDLIPFALLFYRGQCIFSFHSVRKDAIIEG